MSIGNACDAICMSCDDHVMLYVSHGFHMMHITYVHVNINAVCDSYVTLMRLS